MRKKPKNPGYHRQELYEQQIIEIVPGDLFVDCWFESCEFVGIGGAEMKRCKIINTSSSCRDVINCHNCTGNGVRHS